MQLSKNFSLKELTKSETAIRRGIPNEPSAEQIENLKTLVENVLQPLRDYFNLPLVVNSGYRSPAVNTLIGGSATSQHMKGEAADIVIPTVDLKDVYLAIMGNLPYDQLIYEFDSWIHVSFNFIKNRRQNLIAEKKSGKTVYRTYQNDFKAL